MKKTPAQWLEHFTQSKEDSISDPEFLRIRRGASIYIFGHYRRGFFDGDNLFGRKLLKEEEILVGNFKGFLTNYGNKLFENWLLTGKLSGKDKKYFYILNGLCFSIYFKELRPKIVLEIPFSLLEKRCWSYSQKVMRRGTKIIRKGYRKQILTEKEIADLRLHAMWADITSSTWAATEGNNFLPFHLGLSRPFDKTFPKKKMNYSLHNSTYKNRPSIVTSLLYPGDKAPDFTLIKPDSIYENKNYSDNNPFTTETLLQPQIMFEILNALAAYDTGTDADGKKTALPKPVVPADRDKNEYVSLSSYQGKKPVLIFPADPTDTWAWNTHIVEMVDCLYKTYREKIECIFVNITAYDGYMPVYDFFDPVPGKMIAGHPVTREERARISKMFYMSHPQISIPSILDDVGQTTRNSYMDQGGTGSFCLVNIEGRVAYRDICLEGKNLETDQKYFTLPDTMRIRINALEIEIRKLLKNNGKMVPSRENCVIKGKPEKSFFDARISEIYIDTGKLKVEVPCEENPPQPENTSSYQIKNFYASTNYPPKPIFKSHTVDITDQTRIAQAEEGNYQILSLENLSIGQKINIDYKAEETEHGSSYRASHIYNDNLRLYHCDRYEKTSIWFFGYITNLDSKKNIVTAVMPKEAAQEMKGYFFWEEAGNRATLLDRTKETVPIVKKWVEGNEDDRTYRFKIDSGVNLFVNGHPGSFTGLKKGDSVSVDYRTIQDGQKLIYPDMLRASGKL